jgi:hypothetical protein
MRSKVLLVAAGLLLGGAASAHAQAFTEGFDNITTLPGSGWFLQNNSQPLGVTGWFQGNSGVFPAQTGAPNAYIAANFNNGAGTATISNWLLTPAVTLVNGATLNFWTRKIASSFPDRLQVRMSTAGNGTDVGTTATSVGTFTTLLLDINPTYAPDPAYPIVWTQFNVTVTGVATPTLGRLAFRYFVENGGPSGANSDYIGIDTVVFTPGVTPATVAPVSLAVDTAGNGVLQPNESAVVVAPSWMNTSTVSIAALTGVLSNFTGPVGPTYTINDAAANYGSLAAGATASCGSNCYAVTATAAVRPATHWDASALETVSVGPTTKTWTLHVGDSFTDVPPSNPFYRFVETILHRGITGGCTATAYCPTNSTTRAQMAVFVLVAKEGAGYTPPACTTPVFADVPASSPFCPFVEELARRGVVSGCGGGNYCPNNPVTREQMAVFVLRTLDPALNPPACAPPNLYNDVPETSAFCRWIEELTNRNVVTGCGGGNYCPTAPVTRGQMGVFLAAGFSLTLYGL